MRDPWLQAAGARYCVELLEEASPGPAGIGYRREGERCLLAWDGIHAALAAEVGEPEGVRTIVFDLVTQVAAGEWRVNRFDAEPGQEAMEVARQLEQALGPERAGASIKSVATDGIPSRWFPDIESFEHDALGSLESVLKLPAGTGR